MCKTSLPETQAPQANPYSGLDPVEADQLVRGHLPDDGGEPLRAATYIIQAVTSHRPSRDPEELGAAMVAAAAVNRRALRSVRELARIVHVGAPGPRARSDLIVLARVCDALIDEYNAWLAWALEERPELSPWAFS